VSRFGAYFAAVAYRLPELQQAPQRSRRTPYRLLGGSTGIAVAPSPRMPLALRASSAPARGHLEMRLRPEPAYTAHYQTPRPTTARTRLRVGIAHPQWLLGTLACVMALVAVGPVMASGQRRVASGEWRVFSPATGASHSPLATNHAPSQPHAAPAVKPPKPSPARPTRSYELLGPPSLSVGAIEAVLSQYGSEAAGRGRALYDLGVRYGIDPAYALAFFVHESACGTRGVARFTHSIGNIRWTSGYDNYEGYRSYATWEQGMEDWYKLITDLYINGWGLRTVDAIIPVYAPYGDNNDPPSYIADVQSLVDAWRGK